jgi:hypothetical protein
MPKAKLNPILASLSGALGKGLVIRQMRDGSFIVSAKPDFSGRKFSKDQLTHQSRFQEAAVYARNAAKTQPIYTQLAEGTTKTAYNIALSDWFNPPVIHNIEQHKSGLIRIEATDNVLVTKVIVTILDAEERVLEKGEAMLIKGFWEYIPAAYGKVRVETHDLAGNTASKEMAL